MSEKFSVSSPDFVSFSCLCPVLTFEDIMNNITWEYRTGGPVDCDEAVVIIPSVYETTNSCYLLARLIMDAGYRVLMTSLPPYETAVEYMNGFDLLTAHVGIMKMHLVGMGFGGILACHLTQFSSLSAEIKSLSLVASFMDAQIFSRSMTIFVKLTGKSDLINEQNKSKLPEHLKPACDFVIAEIEALPKTLIGSRIALRTKTTPASVPKIDPDRVLVIQPLDWAFTMTDAIKPHKVIKGCKCARIPKGGNHPHIANPEGVADPLKEHLSKWHSPVQRSE